MNAEMSNVFKFEDLSHVDEHGPGQVRVNSGRLIDLADPRPNDFLIEDIAWALGTMVRYNGHIPYPYTVARHSIIMSYYVPAENAMEALLHDAGEAYCGDIIKPLKRLYPDLEDFEDNITAVIHNKFNGGKNVHFSDTTTTGYIYKKSDIIAHTDVLIYQHECYRFNRPGRYVPGMHNAERQAMHECGLGSLYMTGMQGDREAFLNRFYDLCGKY